MRVLRIIHRVLLIALLCLSAEDSRAQESRSLAPDEAEAVNAEAPGVLAEATEDVDGLFVHYSTDYVFDGTATRPYTENDDPTPINEYGRSKRKGERAVQQVGGRYLILRTSWVYSHRRSNFLLTMLRLADDNESLTVVDDQTGSPTWAGWIAEATTSILRHLQDRRASADLAGLYHLAATGQTSWYGFAQAIFAQFGREDVNVEPVTSDEYPTTAARPRYTVLDSNKVRDTFDLSIPTWTEQLAELRDRMIDT